MTARATPLCGRLAGEAHLWLTPLPPSLPAATEQAWSGLLSAAEAAAWRRFRVDGARCQHLAARALVRTTLSRYADVEPAAWRFRTGPHGRPEIAAPEDLPALRFNLSHTRGLVACLVTLGLDAGVDVEHHREIRDPLAIAEHSFAEFESAEVRRCRGAERRQRFYDLWTLKEAYVKARGAGFLSIQTRRFGYQLGGDGIVRLRSDPAVEPQPEAWQLALVAPSSEHRLAVAIRRGGRRPDLVLAAWQVEPLVGEPAPVTLRLLARSPAPERLAATADG